MYIYLKISWHDAPDHLDYIVIKLYTFLSVLLWGNRTRGVITLCVFCCAEADIHIPMQYRNFYRGLVVFHSDWQYGSFAILTVVHSGHLLRNWLHSFPTNSLHSFPVNSRGKSGVRFWGKSGVSLWGKSGVSFWGKSGVSLWGKSGVCLRGGGRCVPPYILYKWRTKRGVARVTWVVQNPWVSSRLNYLQLFKMSFLECIQCDYRGLSWVFWVNFRTCKNIVSEMT